MSVIPLNYTAVTRGVGVDDQASRLRHLVGRHQEAAAVGKATPAAPLATARRARVVAITSGKGGVGKTNIAVNLAGVLARAGRGVVLLDADMGLANADVLCGLNLRYNLAHVVARRKSLEDVLAVGPGGFRLAAGATGLGRMADLPPAEHARLLASLDTLEMSADLILVDTGAGISPNVLSFTRAADDVLVVTTPEPTAVTDAYATIKVVLRDRAGDDTAVPPRILLLVNQAKSAAEARAVYTRVGKVAREFLGVVVDDAGHVPADAAVRRAVQARRPFTTAEPQSPAAEAVVRLASRLEGGIVTRGMSTPGRFFSRLARRIAG